MEPEIAMTSSYQLFDTLGNTWYYDSAKKEATRYRFCQLSGKVKTVLI